MQLERQIRDLMAASRETGSPLYCQLHFIV